MSFEPVPQEEGRRRYQSAYPLATKLTASLGLRGFRLNLAVEAAGSYEELLEVELVFFLPSAARESVR